MTNFSGMQCSAVVNNSYFVVVREGVKSAYTVDSALIQDVSVSSLFYSLSYMI